METKKTILKMEDGMKTKLFLDMSIISDSKSNIFRPLKLEKKIKQHLGLYHGVPWYVCAYVDEKLITKQNINI